MSVARKLDRNQRAMEEFSRESLGRARRRVYTNLPAAFNVQSDRAHNVLVEKLKPLVDRLKEDAACSSTDTGRTAISLFGMLEDLYQAALQKSGEDLRYSVFALERIAVAADKLRAKLSMGTLNDNGLSDSAKQRMLRRAAGAGLTLHEDILRNLGAMPRELGVGIPDPPGG